jgi:omega-6 fatty acid desaturase (delta-12 desaturase)
MAIQDPESITPVEGQTKTGQIWPDWHQQLKSFGTSNTAAAVRQLLNTLIPYFCLWYLMIRSVQLGYPYILTLVLAIPTAAFLVRLFILFHDCVHNSFFTSKRANTFFGYVLGLLVFTSFEDWRFTHLHHHGTYANLDSRGFGDIWTMTLNEYKNSSWLQKFRYRIYRNPIVLFGLGPLFIFFFFNRFPDLRSKRKERMSIIFTNLLILAFVLAVAQLIGWRAYLMIQLPVLWLAGAAGIWLFYVQHQFEGGYWARGSAWDPLRAAMEGSSFYKLPPVLRWFSASIGYHHVHHLNPMIPNYHLVKCYESVDQLQARQPLTIRNSLRSHSLKLWDEDVQQMVAFP